MSFPRFCFTCFFLLSGFGVELANSLNYKIVGGKLLPYKTIIVDQSGKGNFKTIQSAVDSVPSNNEFWVSINVKAGTYREKLVIPNDKPYIILRGEGKANTFVDWADHDNTLQSATFTTLADNIIVKFMSFRNSYKNNPIRPAVAALVSGDKAYFLDVGFFSFQDTLWDDHGSHYYKHCTIQGAVDFIFGNGQSLYEDCTISVIAAPLGAGISGIITAQSRESSNQSSGFVFKNCNIKGSGTTYLGRPWRKYAKVLFYQTNMANIIQPCGWDLGHFGKEEIHTTFAEYNSFGPGFTSSDRKWNSTLDSKTINWLASFSFIDSVGWLKISLNIGS